MCLFVCLPVCLFVDGLGNELAVLSVVSCMIFLIFVRLYLSPFPSFPSSVLSLVASFFFFVWFFVCSLISSLILHLCFSLLLSFLFLRGVPAVVDLAAMRDAMQRLGGDPRRINPLVSVDLVVDHSVQVDYSRSAAAFQRNLEKEMQRNKERFAFLKWGSKAFNNMRIVPPGSGIVHQVNLEFLASVVMNSSSNNSSSSNISGSGMKILYPDSVVGTDSHTTMVNGLGVLGWGVGGIEAEAVMLGQHISMVLPEVIGVHLTGQLGPLVTATDLVLTLTEMLRRKGVVGKFVEFFGPGLERLSLADRATVSNMAPEYGCGEQHECVFKFKI